MGAVKKMNSKGVLFSLLSLVLVIVLVSLSGIIPEKIDNLVEHKNTLFLSQRDSFFHGAISRNILDIQDFSIPQYESQSIYFDKFGSSNSSTDITQDIVSYKNFIESNFSDSANAQLELNGSFNIFDIPVYSFRVTSSDLSVLTSLNASLLDSINLSIIVGVDDTDLQSTSSPGDSGDGADPLISVNVYDTQGDPVGSYSINLDSAASNADFNWTFTAGTVSMNYGSNGILNLFASGIDASFTNARFTFSENKSLYGYFNGTLGINDKSRSLVIK